MILLLGSEGSMGKRYQAILKYLKVEFIPIDAGKTEEFIFELAARADGIIVASPTDTHIPYLKLFSGLKKPVLCEKPVSKELNELRETLGLYKTSGTPISMMFQYSLLTGPGVTGMSYYNYFRHGNDGLVWDCMQIIALSKGEVMLEESSPWWICTINGRPLNQADMDFAYLQYVKKWLAGQAMDPDEIYDIHLKTDLVAKSYG